MVKHEQELIFPPFRLYPFREQLWRETERVLLRPKTFAVLRYLVEHAGQVVTRSELLQAVWPDTYGAEGLPRECIHELRQLLGDGARAPRFIETVGRRQGYRWIAPLQSAPSVEQQELSGPWSLDSEHQNALLVGRETERARLHQWLAKALNGERQVVFVTGEPGIGKTTLVETFIAELGTMPSSPAPSSKSRAPIFVGQGQCIEHYGSGEAYLPILEALGRLCRQLEGARIVALLERHAPTWLVQMPALIDNAEFEALQRKVIGATRERMLRELADAVEVITAERPLVLILEDLHWSDYSTLDWLTMVARRREAARLLIIGTYRPADVIVGKHPLKAMKEELQQHGQCTEMALKGLSSTAVSQYLGQRFLLLSPTATEESQFLQLARVIHRNTEGNPLFMVNVVDELVAQGTIQAVDHCWQVLVRVEDIAVQVPESLRQLIERQIQRLSAEEQQMLEVASITGAEFSAAVVAAAIGSSIEQMEEQCEDLVRRGQFLHALGSETLPDGMVTARYGFLHALYQAALYERLSSARRVRLHRRIGESEEQRYGGRAGEMAAELALHFEWGQDSARAVQYHQQAAQTALQRSAYQEAIAHLTKGVDLLKTLPDTLERGQQELTLQHSLGLALSATKGYSALEVEKVYVRVRALCAQVGETPQLFFALQGLSLFHLVRGELETALDLVRRRLTLAQRLNDLTLLSEAHTAMARILFYRGEFTASREQAEQALALYDPQYHRLLISLYGQDTRLVCLSMKMWTLWNLGYPDQAIQEDQNVLALAQELAHPYSLTATLWNTSLLHQYRREGPATQRCAEAAMSLATQQGFSVWLALGTLLRGWALVEQGREEEGVTQMEQGWAAYQAVGTGLARSQFCVLLAEGYGKMRQAEKGLRMLAEALTLIGKNGERLSEAEVYRVKGELTLQQLPVQEKHRATKKRAKSKGCSPQSSRHNPH